MGKSDSFRLDFFQPKHDLENGKTYNELIVKNLINVKIQQKVWEMSDIASEPALTSFPPPSRGESIRGNWWRGWLGIL